MSASQSLDRAALRDGVSVAALGAVPFGIVAQFLGGDDASGSTRALLVLAVVGALVLGAGVAAWRQTQGRPLTHALVTALATFAAIQAVGIVRRLVVGEPVHWSRIASGAVVSLAAGLAGGLLGTLLLAQGMTPSTGAAADRRPADRRPRTQEPRTQEPRTQEPRTQERGPQQR